jgi:hypothetical protein
VLRPKSVLNTILKNRNQVNFSLFADGVLTEYDPIMWLNVPYTERMLITMQGFLPYLSANMPHGTEVKVLARK